MKSHKWLRNVGLAVINLGAAFFLYILVTAPVGQKYSTQIDIIDGVVYNVSNNEKFTGRIIDTVDNNILEYDVINGLKNGEFTVTFLNGQVKVHGYVRDNKNVGEWKYFYTNGKMETSGYFTNDMAEGKWTWYYPNGNVKEVGEYSDGERDGTWILYDEEGNLKSKLIFSKGEKVNEFEVPKFKIS